MQRSVRRFEHQGRCPDSGKKMFDQLSAYGLAKELRRNRDSNHQPYVCPVCRSWHVGSSAIGRPPKTRPATPWRPLPVHHYQQKAA